MARKVKVSSTVSADSVNLASMTKEQLIAMLGDKYQVIPKVDDSKLSVTLTEYKGKPMISIIKGQESFVNRPMNLGVAKCKLIIEALDEIKAFVKANTSTK